MNQLKRYAALLLLAAMTLALSTPAYLIHVRPGSAVYHRNLFVFASQVIPYAVCAVVWLPSRNPSAPKIAFGLSTALFVAACLLYVPVFVHPEIVGGDMVGLGYILVCLVTTAAGRRDLADRGSHRGDPPAHRSEVRRPRLVRRIEREMAIQCARQTGPMSAFAVLLRVE